MHGTLRANAQSKRGTFVPLKKGYVQSFSVWASAKKNSRKVRKIRLEAGWCDWTHFHISGLTMNGET